MEKIPQNKIYYFWFFFYFFRFFSDFYVILIEFFKPNIFRI